MAYPELMQGSFAGTEDILHQLNQGKPVSCYIEDLAEPFRSIQGELGVQGLYAIPIFVQGLLWGAIGFDDCHADKQRHAVELSVLKITADCIGSAIQRQRTQQALLQAEQQRGAELAQANEVLQGRDRLLETTAIAANTLLSTANFDDAVNTVLQLIGEALDTDRVKVLECIYHSSLYPAYSVISHEWVREGIIPQISHPSSSRISSDGAEDFLHQLVQSDGFGGVLREWPEAFWDVFEAVEAKAIYCVPIRLEEQIWGFLIFDDCQDVKQRDLSELSVLKIAANCIGNAIQRQRTQQALTQADDAREAAILEERNRMAGEIHDTLAQTFTGISLQVEVAKPLLGQDSPAVSTILDHLKCLAETGLAEARRSVWALYPPAAEYAELAQLLYESVEYMSRNTATQIEVNVDGPPGPLPPFLGMNLLRIGQEALTNALKHAQAQTITIDLTYAGDRILLQICDDGIGFVPPRTLDPLNGGFGLVGMYERVRSHRCTTEPLQHARAGHPNSRRSPLEFRRGRETLMTTPQGSNGQRQLKRQRQRIPFSLSARYPAVADHPIMNPLPIRVLIADDHPVVRSGLVMIVQSASGVEVVAEASTGTEAVELFRQYQPDVALMDLKMPELGGVDAITAIRQKCLHARIIILTTYDGDEDIYRGLSAGARGYLLKKRHPPRADRCHSAGSCRTEVHPR